jgi:HAD superfamily hydrolase (TIGR01509 family)
MVVYRAQSAWWLLPALVAAGLAAGLALRWQAWRRAPTTRWPEAVLFDHDGTLVDSEDSHRAHWNAVLEPWGVSLDLALYQQIYAGMPTADNAADIVQRFGLQISAQALADAKNERTRDWLRTQAFPLMPGVVEVLDALQKNGVRLAVVTGARRYAIDATLRWHGLAHRFETVVCAEDVVCNKPHPAVYQLALERLGLKASDCVALEDTEHGLAAAAAGVPCVAIPTRFSAEHNFSKAASVQPHLLAALAWMPSRR